MSKYQFCVNQHARDYNGVAPREVAKLVQVPSSHAALIFYYSKGFSKRTKYPMAVQGGGMVNGSYAAYMDDDYKKLLYEKPQIFEALALHELGHIEKGHLAKMTSDERVRRYRKAFNQTGRADPREIEADAFAAAEVGAERMIKALEWSIERRKKANDLNADRAINEMKTRISCLKNLEK